MENDIHPIKRLEKFCWYLTRNRLGVLLVIILVAGAVSCGALRIRGDVILQDMFPYNHDYLKLHARFSEVFGSGASGVAIALKVKDGSIFDREPLLKLKKMTEEVVFWDETYRQLTTSIASFSAKIIRAKGKGEISISPLMWPDVPATPEEMAQLKNNIFSTPSYNGIFVSRDGSAALIFTEFKEGISYERTFGLLRDLAERYSDDRISVHIVGFPMLMGWIYHYKGQMRTVFFISIALTILILFYIFRNVTGMIAPLSVGLLSTGIGLGFVGWTGINFSPLLYVLAFLVGARKISHSVQVTSRYLEELHESRNDKNTACYHTMRTMIMPNVAGVTTDAAGFLVLIFAKIILMQQIAVIMTVWMLSIAFSAILTPIICTYVPLKKAGEKWSKESSKIDWLDNICLAATRFSIGPGKYLVFGTVLLLFAFVSWEASRLKIGDPTPGSPLLWPDHIYNRDQAYLDNAFDASSENFILFYEGEKGSVYDPTVLTTFAKFDRYMKEQLPDLYKSSSSIIHMVGMVNSILHDGDPLWRQLPREENLLTSVIGYTRQNTGRGALERFVDNTLERSRITLFFSDHTSGNLLRIRDTAYEFFKNNPMQTDKGEFKLAGGRIGLEIAVNEEMKRSHLVIDSMVLFAIFLMCSLTFRSFVAGLMLSLPLVVANMLAFAYMSVTNIGLSINTLPVAAIGVGVGVDFAIYLYSRFQEEYAPGGDWERTVLFAVRTSGKAVVYTGLTLIWAIIPWYFLSAMKFQAQMGFFLSMLLLANVVLALTLHPALVMVVKPKFIKGRQSPYQPNPAQPQSVNKHKIGSSRSQLIESPTKKRGGE